GEAALAEESLRQALDAAPTDVAVRVELSQLLVQTNRADQAVTLLEETVNRNPTNIPAREALTRAYVTAKDIDAAKVAAENLKTPAPNEPAGYSLAGLIAQTQRRMDDAIANFDRALELKPDSLDTLAAVTRLDWGLGKRDRALARINAAI